MASTHHLMIEGRDDWFVIKALLRADGGEVRETGSRSVHEVRWRSKRRLLEVSDHETEHGVSNCCPICPSASSRAISSGSPFDQGHLGLSVSAGRAAPPVRPRADRPRRRPRAHGVVVRQGLRLGIPRRHARFHVLI